MWRLSSSRSLLNIGSQSLYLLRVRIPATTNVLTSFSSMVGILSYILTTNQTSPCMPKTNCPSGDSNIDMLSLLRG